MPYGDSAGNGRDRSNLADDLEVHPCSVRQARDSAAVALTTLAPHRRDPSEARDAVGCWRELYGFRLFRCAERPLHRFDELLMRLVVELANYM